MSNNKNIRSLVQIGSIDLLNSLVVVNVSIFGLNEVLTQEIDRMKIIYFDLETTGLTPLTGRKVFNVENDDRP